MMADAIFIFVMRTLDIIEPTGEDMEKQINLTPANSGLAALAA